MQEGAAIVSLEVLILKLTVAFEANQCLLGHHKSFADLTLTPNSTSLHMRRGSSALVEGQRPFSFRHAPQLAGPHDVNRLLNAQMFQMKTEMHPIFHPCFSSFHSGMNTFTLGKSDTLLKKKSLRMDAPHTEAPALL